MITTTFDGSGGGSGTSSGSENSKDRREATKRKNRGEALDKRSGRGGKSKRKKQRVARAHEKKKGPLGEKQKQGKKTSYWCCSCQKVTSSPGGQWAVCTTLHDQGGKATDKVSRRVKGKKKKGNVAMWGGSTAEGKCAFRTKRLRVEETPRKGREGRLRRRGEGGQKKRTRLLFPEKRPRRSNLSRRGGKKSPCPTPTHMFSTQHGKVELCKP